MASYFTRKKSPFYLLKVKRNGEWTHETSNIRKDAPNSVRSIKRRIAEENGKELANPSERNAWAWAPAWLGARYHGKTLIRYVECWTCLDIFLAEKNARSPSDVSRRLCQEYPDWRTKIDPEIMRPCKWNTALTELKVLSVIMTEAANRGYILANPCFRLGFKRIGTKKKPEVKADAQATIEKALTKPWMRDSWTIAMTQGFRLSETAIPVANVDLQRDVVWVTGKGGKIHCAPLHPAVRAIAERAIADGRSVLVEFPKSPAKEWWVFFKKLGLPHSFHSTRVTVVTRLARAGFSKVQTMAYVGHASETVHDVYTRLSAPDVAHLGPSLQAFAPESAQNLDAPSTTQTPTPASNASQASETPPIAYPV